MGNELKYKCCLCEKGICKYKADLEGQAIWVDSLSNIDNNKDIEDERIICIECSKAITEELLDLV